MSGFKFRALKRRIKIDPTPIDTLSVLVPMLPQALRHSLFELKKSDSNFKYQIQLRPFEEFTLTR
jgi:hypothetical protein